MLYAVLLCSYSSSFRQFALLVPIHLVQPVQMTVKNMPLEDEHDIGDDTVAEFEGNPSAEINGCIEPKNK